MLDDKREGHYLTGFPALGFDDATKFNYGVALQFYDNGPRDSPFFRQHAIPAQGRKSRRSDTTGGFRTLLVDYDETYVADTPWRLERPRDNLTNNEREKYFGVGGRRARRPHLPGLDAGLRQLRRLPQDASSR